jgi:hypothetical protein
VCELVFCSKKLRAPDHEPEINYLLLGARAARDTVLNKCAADYHSRPVWIIASAARRAVERTTRLVRVFAQAWERKCAIIILVLAAISCRFAFYCYAYHVHTAGNLYPFEHSADRPWRSFAVATGFAFGFNILMLNVRTWSDSCSLLQ